MPCLILHFTMLWFHSKELCDWRTLTPMWIIIYLFFLLKLLITLILKYWKGVISRDVSFSSTSKPKFLFNNCWTTIAICFYLLLLRIYKFNYAKAILVICLSSFFWPDSLTVINITWKIFVVWYSVKGK